MISLQPSIALAVAFSVLGRSGETRLSVKHLPPAWPVDVASLSATVLAKAKSEGAISSFKADEDGVYEIEGPTNDIEILSERELRAWGWCYELNGSVPETMPAVTLLTSDQDRVTWFYGFAHYKDGEWVAQCVPGRNALPIGL